MRNVLFAFMVSLGLLVLMLGTNPVPLTADSDNNHRVDIVDDCDPNDPLWAPTGGCFLEGGRVGFAEFGAFLVIPNIAAVVGHPAWRMSPSYLPLESGKRLRVRNVGGRTHTFTEVPEFGAGRIGPPNVGLNFGLTQVAQGCPGSIDIVAGGRTEVDDLSMGNHKFQCCIHPWMRAVVKVVPKD